MMKTSNDNPRPPETLTLTAQMEISAGADGGDPSAGPGLPRFSMVAYTGGPMRLAGWRYPVVVDLAGLSIPSQSRPIRFGHDASSGVGHSDSIRVDAGKLIAAGVVSRDTAAAREIVVSARNGFPWQASIGAAVERFEFIREGQSVLVNGRQLAGPLNVVRRSTLGEISFVDLGADNNTSASVAASDFAKATSDRHRNQENTNMEDNAANTGTAVTDSDTTTQDAATKNGDSSAAPARDGGAATRQPAPPATVNASADGGIAGDPVADMRIRAAAEQERIAAVRKVCGDAHADIAARAIRDGWDVKDAELAILRADRPKAPAAHVPDNSMTPAVLEAACMLTGKVTEPEKLFDEKTLDAAGRRFRGGIGLQELLLEAAWTNGYDGRNFRDSRNVLRFAFAQNIQAGFSTIDIAGFSQMSPISSCWRASSPSSGSGGTSARCGTSRTSRPSRATA